MLISPDDRKTTRFLDAIYTSISSLASPVLSSSSSSSPASTLLVEVIDFDWDEIIEEEGENEQLSEIG